MASWTREELLTGGQKTTAIPSSTPVSTPKQEEKKKTQPFRPLATSDAPTYTPHVRGAAFSVVDKLDNIAFVNGTVGGMSAVPAYIRYWRRAGVEQKTGVNQEREEQNIPFDSQEAFSKDLKQAFSGEFKGVDLGVNTTLKGTYTWDNAKTIPPVDWTQAPPVIPGVPQVLNPPPPGSTTVPTNTYKTKPPTAPPPAPPRSNNFFKNLLQGVVFSANPSGVVETATASAPITDAVWQFMFNPEELQLESGPDYNRAETWGVQDGQALSWRNNKNQKLIFGKVLLHGYTFGKRVDSLEAGLQNLFMARDGENGADGPPVLEFVWGKRVFGPCVIQNIRVREQSWDHGILVNAEVSFELEKVPEWTINDGYVDIARPGKQPVINDPTLPAAESSSSSGTEGRDTQNPENNEGAGGNGNAQRGQNANLCNFAVKTSQKFQKLYESYNRAFSPFSTVDLEEARRLRVRFLDEKMDFYKSSKEIGGYVDRKLGGRNLCTNQKYRKNTYDVFYADRPDDPNYDEVGIERFRSKKQAKFIQECIKDTKKYIDDWQQSSPKCKPQRDLGKRQRICENYVIGKPCSSSEPRYTSCRGVIGYGVKCRDGKWIRLNE